MKKIFTLLCAAAFCGAISAQTSHRYDVANKTQFNETMDAIATLPAGDAAYVYISGYVDVGTLKNDASGKMQPTLRNIHFIGVDDEETGERATLSMEMQIPTNNTEADQFSLHYENLKLRQTQGEWGNSKHLMNFKDANKHYIDTLEFRNCELTNICRSIYRGEAQNTEADAGTMKVMIMENCTVHNGSRQSNAMPLFYMAQPINEIIFRNNTFYDLTYLNSIVSYGTMTEATGIKDLKFWFENNTVCAYSKSTLFNFNDKNGNAAIGGGSELHFKNNFFLFPNWTDEANNRVGDSKDSHDMAEEATTRDEAGATTFGYMTEEEIAARIEKGTALTAVTTALVQLEKNVLYGYKMPKTADAITAGDIIPIGDTEEEFFEDFEPALTMEDVPFAWSDFTDAQNDMFQINFANPAYTAGKNGAPLGDTNNYTDKVIKLVKLTVNVEGSKSASVTVSPVKDVYQSGDEVTLTANTNGSLNTFEGWSTGAMEPSIKVTMGEEDMNISAIFKEIDYVAVWNLDQLEANNVVITPPAKPNYGKESITLDYARFIVPVVEEGAEPVDGSYVSGEELAAITDTYDGAKRAIQTRNNKVSGDVRNCFLITTPHTQFTTEGGGLADYLFLNFAEAQEPSKLHFFVASDNIPYNNYAVSYTTDGQEWTEAGKFTMVDRAATNEWYEVEVELPALAAGSKVRIKGIESEGMYISPDMQETIIDAGGEINTEFLFVAELILMPNGENGISELQGNAKQQQSPVYNLMGIRVNGQTKGLLIQNGKKFIVK